VPLLCGLSTAALTPLLAGCRENANWAAAWPAAREPAIGSGSGDVLEEDIDLEPFRSGKSSSGYRGVGWSCSSRKYQAEITVNGNKRMYLGVFDTAEEAARAYARAYRRQHEVQPMDQAEEEDEGAAEDEPIRVD